MQNIIAINNEIGFFCNAIQKIVKEENKGLNCYKMFVANMEYVKDFEIEITVADINKDNNVDDETLHFKDFRIEFKDPFRTPIPIVDDIINSLTHKGVIKYKGTISSGYTIINIAPEPEAIMIPRTNGENILSCISKNLNEGPYGLWYFEETDSYVIGGITVAFDHLDQTKFVIYSPLFEILGKLNKNLTEVISIESQENSISLDLLEEIIAHKNNTRNVAYVFGVFGISTGIMDIVGNYFQLETVIGKTKGINLWSENDKLLNKKVHNLLDSKKPGFTLKDKNGEDIWITADNLKHNIDIISEALTNKVWSYCEHLSECGDYGIYRDFDACVINNLEIKYESADKVTATFEKDYCPPDCDDSDEDSEIEECEEIWDLNDIIDSLFGKIDCGKLVYKGEGKRNDSEYVDSIDWNCLGCSSK